MDNKELVKQLEGQAERLEKVVKKYDEKALSKRPEEGKWSAKEIIGHLADVESAYGYRIRMALAQSGTGFQPFDQNLWVENLKHQEKEAKELVKTFERLRKANLAVLKYVKDEEWERYGMHPERGKMTVENLVTLLAEHFERHVQQVERVAGS